MIIGMYVRMTSFIAMFRHIFRQFTHLWVVFNTDTINSIIILIVIFLLYNNRVYKCRYRPSLFTRDFPITLSSLYCGNWYTYVCDIVKCHSESLASPISSYLWPPCGWITQLTWLTYVLYIVLYGQLHMHTYALLHINIF